MKNKKSIMRRKLQIGVLGWAGKEEYPADSGPTNEELEMAREVGSLLAKAGVIIVTGGKGGIMEYASRGAKENDSTTVAVITGPRGTSNKWSDVEIVTGSKISGFDEVFIPLMCDAVIVIGGGVGTMQEISVCYRNKIPIIVMENTFGWASKILKEKYLDSRKTTKIIPAKNARDAVEKAIKQVKIK